MFFFRFFFIIGYYKILKKLSFLAFAFSLFIVRWFHVQLFAKTGFPLFLVYPDVRGSELTVP